MQLAWLAGAWLPDAGLAAETRTKRALSEGAHCIWSWHGVMWLGGEDQEARLGYKVLGCKCKEQARGLGELHVNGPSAMVKSK